MSSNNTIITVMEVINTPNEVDHNAVPTLVIVSLLSEVEQTKFPYTSPKNL